MRTCADERITRAFAARIHTKEKLINVEMET